MGEAIRKMTSLPARNLGLQDRGVIRTGAFADLVLFDTTAVLDHATTAEPGRPAAGIHQVWVNGEVVYEDGKTTGRYPGRALRSGPPRLDD
jgi:N-acyl-D-amino-acid deacylase